MQGGDKRFTAISRSILEMAELLVTLIFGVFAPFEECAEMSTDGC